MTEAFIFCDGYARVGWKPGCDQIEFWLAEHLLRFVSREYPAQYASYVGPRILEQDGSICRLPTDEERRIVDWKLYR